MNSDGAQISGHLAAIPAFFQFVLDLLIVGETSHSRPFDCGNMDKNILTAVIRGNETKALRRIEPFHGAGGHHVSPSVLLLTQHLFRGHCNVSIAFQIWVPHHGRAGKVPILIVACHIWIFGTGIAKIKRNRVALRGLDGYLDQSDKESGMILYGLKNCDTCRTARKALKDIEFVDVRTDSVPPEVLDAAMVRFGKALLNTRSTTWRGLDEATRALPERELLVAHPTLMKRPLIIDDGEMYLGWGKDVQAALVG